MAETFQDTSHSLALSYPPDSLQLVSALSYSRSHRFAGVQRHIDRLRGFDNSPRFFDFRGRAMHHQQELVRLERHFVLNDTILRNTHAIETRADGAQTSDDRGAFQPSHDPRDQGTRHEHRTDDPE